MFYSVFKHINHVLYYCYYCCVNVHTKLLLDMALQAEIKHV